MGEIIIECEYTLLSDELPKIKHEFHKQVGDSEIKLTINFYEKRIIAEMKNIGIEEIFNSEITKAPGETLSKKFRSKLKTNISEIRSFCRTILSIIKYHLNYTAINENLFSIKSERWGSSNGSLQDIPKEVVISISTNNILYLDNISINHLEQAISSGVSTFRAMGYLHRAKTERNPIYKWVDATIAAELAIKEFLVGIKPELEVILTELPSPPLDKLYGDVLKQYIGEESPYKKAIKKGIEIRNKLVHRHDYQNVDQQKAIDYVLEVEKAIFHLLTIKFPSDAILKIQYHKIKDME